MTKKLKTKPSTGDPFSQPGLRTTDRQKQLEHRDCIGMKASGPLMLSPALQEPESWIPIPTAIPNQL